MRRLLTACFFFIITNITVASDLGNDILELHLPFEGSILPHCVNKPDIFPEAKMEPFFNKHTGFKQCEILIPKLAFYKRFSYCVLIGHGYTAYMDKVSSMYCDLHDRTTNGEDLVVFSSNGVGRSGWCKYKCIK
jgi:hypothetical protein